MQSLKTIFASLLLSLLIAGSAFAADKVNINTADAATLAEVLVNVGPAKAEAIVAHRKANGAFKSADQLAMVKGIGLKTVEKNRDRIVVGSAGPARPAAKPVAASPAKGATNGATKR
ncbi:ComEA family DNA-binding protein [Luteimonas vadosa]|uniref:Helix-hairpin-helix domain-containing protein n=1 Tax=Luteimonas vadosa TaxID=1165507 RepID=A0ABP9DVW2_9GAMM